VINLDFALGRSKKLTSVEERINCSQLMLQEENEMPSLAPNVIAIPSVVYTVYGTHRIVSFDFNLRINSQIRLKISLTVQSRSVCCRFRFKVIVKKKP
jgi:hypothetical protein